MIGGFVVSDSKGDAVVCFAAQDSMPADAFAAPGQWHVLHTRSRQEKILSDELTAMGIWHFLPLCKEVRYYGVRKAKVQLPLFPGYLFLRGTLDQAYQADRTHRVANILQVKNQQQLEGELQQIKRALSYGASMHEHPGLQAGVRVEVRSGPLRGVQGIVESRSSANRLILQVAMLSRAASVEIDADLLEIVESEPAMA